MWMWMHGRIQDFGLGGSQVLTVGWSVVDKWPKSLYNVSRLGGAMAPPMDPPLCGCELGFAKGYLNLLAPSY